MSCSDLIGEFDAFKTAQSTAKEFPTVSQTVSTDESITGNLQFGEKYDNKHNCTKSIKHIALLYSFSHHFIEPSVSLVIMGVDLIQIGLQNQREDIPGIITHLIYHI